MYLLKNVRINVFFRHNPIKPPIQTIQRSCEKVMAGSLRDGYSLSESET